MFKWIKKLIRKLKPKTPHALLEQKLIDLKDTDLRNAAEHAYALAMVFKKEGKNDKAIFYGRDAVALFDRCKLRAEWDSVRRNNVIEGIEIPELIHQGIVKEHLKPLSLAVEEKEEVLEA